MYTIYLSMTIWAVVISGLFLYSKRKSCNSNRTNLQQALPGLTIISAIIAFLCGMGTAMNIYAGLPNKTIIVSTKELVAMRSSDGISGSFFLGSGTIDGNTVYHVFVRNEDGSMSPDQVYASATTRILENKSLTNQGYWRVIQVVKDESTPRAKWALADDDNVVSTNDEFIVPVGTIRQNLSLQ